MADSQDHKLERSQDDSVISHKRGPDRLAFIDALRGIAAISVLLLHVAKIPNPTLDLPSYLDRFVSLGGAGVALFFIVSAFTLSFSIKERNRGGNNVLHFYIRRIFRIVPLFYLLLVFTCLRDDFMFHVSHGWKLILLNIGFGFNFFPGFNTGIVWASWTLGVEMIFYLLFPICFRWMKTSIRAICFIFVSLLAASIFRKITTSLISPESAHDFYINLSFLRQLPVFALGMLAFIIFEWFIESGEISRRWSYVSMGTSIVLFGILSISGFNPMFWMWYLAGVIGVTLLLSLAIRPFGIIVNPITVFLGKISYSLYLNHPPLIFFLIPFYRWLYSIPLSMHLILLIKFSACVVSTLMILIPISYLTYRFVELPGIELGRKFIRSLPPHFGYQHTKK